MAGREEKKEEKKEKKVHVSKGKRKKKKHALSRKYKMYTIQGDKVVARKRHCPRCGPGIFLAAAQNRAFCGKCAYTEFASSTAAATTAAGKK
ncbi:30S ribosomal protein S27ae [Candidatus Pacearchaeota archaeon]|nr:30S ribosomal protein S27ae [Candidatus Pacearchaeota archaeon]